MTPRFAQRREMRKVRGTRIFRRALKKAMRSMGWIHFINRPYTMPQLRKRLAPHFRSRTKPDKLKERIRLRHRGAAGCCSRDGWSKPGVRFVSLTYGGWDHHDNIKNGFGKPDGRSSTQAFAALIPRTSISVACLDSTMVMVTTEFGRTPKINATNGRDHWPRVFQHRARWRAASRRAQFTVSSDPTGPAKPDSDPADGRGFRGLRFITCWASTRTRISSLRANRPIKIVKDGEGRERVLA